MENSKAALKIAVVLEKRFSHSAKLYRFIKFIVMPFIGNDTYIRRSIKDKIRVNLLVSNKLKKISQVLNREGVEEEKLITKNKRTVLESMIVPSCKSIFKEVVSKDPFVTIMRKKKSAAKKKSKS